MKVKLFKSEGNSLYIYDLSKWYLFQNKAGEYSLCSLYDRNVSYKILEESANELLALGFNRKV